MWGVAAHWGTALASPLHIESSVPTLGRRQGPQRKQPGAKRMAPWFTTHTCVYASMHLRFALDTYVPMNTYVSSYHAKGPPTLTLHATADRALPPRPLQAVRHLRVSAVQSHAARC